MRYEQLFNALKKNLAENQTNIVMSNSYEALGDGVGFSVDDEATAKELANYINIKFFSGEEIAKIQKIPSSVVLDKINVNVLLSFFELNLPEQTKVQSGVSVQNLVTPYKNAPATSQATRTAMLAESNDPDSVLVVHFCDSDNDIDSILEHGLLTRNERISRGLLKAEEASKGAGHDRDDLIFFRVIPNEKEFREFSKKLCIPWVAIRVSGESIIYDSELRATENSRYYSSEIKLADLLKMSSSQRAQIGSGSSSFEVVLDKALEPNDIVETSRGVVNKRPSPAGGSNRK